MQGSKWDELVNAVNTLEIWLCSAYISQLIKAGLPNVGCQNTCTLGAVVSWYR